MKHFVVHKMQNVLTQGGVQTPKLIYFKKVPEIKHF